MCLQEKVTAGTVAPNLHLKIKVSFSRGYKVNWDNCFPSPQSCNIWGQNSAGCLYTTNTETKTTVSAEKVSFPVAMLEGEWTWEIPKSTAKIMYTLLHSL